MRMIDRAARVAALVLAFGLSGGSEGWAQALSSRLYGVILSVDAAGLKLTTEEGEVVPVTIPPTLAVSALAERTLADIRPGDYVGSAARTGTDGKLHALEVHIFPESQRGTGEGSRPMDAPDTSMTNAAVEGLMTSGAGGTLHLTYKGGDKTIVVDPDTRIVAFIPGDRGLLKPGATVRVFGAPGPDGTIVARGVQAEKDGVKPLR